MAAATMAGPPAAGRRTEAPLPGAFSFARALATLALLLVATGAVAECAVPAPIEQQPVDFVYDGDTIRLKDGRKLRLVGVNTPETAKKDRPGEPLADEAREALRRLIGPGGVVGVATARDPRDRYGRVLAYVFDAQGRDLQAQLLQQGMAAAIAMPPNVAHVPCYFTIEQQARDNKLGIWAQPYYQPLALPATPKEGGFMRVQGKVTRVGNSRKSVWLNFSPGDGAQARQGLSVRVAREDLAWFPTLDPATLQGRTIIARGWVSFYKKEPVLRVRHEAAVQVLD